MYCTAASLYKTGCTYSSPCILRIQGLYATVIHTRINAPRTRSSEYTLAFLAARYVVLGKVLQSAKPERQN